MQNGPTRRPQVTLACHCPALRQGDPRRHVASPDARLARLRGSATRPARLDHPLPLVLTSPPRHGPARTAAPEGALPAKPARFPRRAVIGTEMARSPSPSPGGRANAMAHGRCAGQGTHTRAGGADLPGLRRRLRAATVGPAASSPPPPTACALAPQQSLTWLAYRTEVESRQRSPENRCTCYDPARALRSSLCF